MRMGELVAGVLLAFIVTLAMVAVASPRWRRRLPRLAGLSLGKVASRGQAPGRSPVSTVHPARKQEV
jgi:hypothetical protein